MSNWTIAALPLLGIILGAVLQFLLSRAADKDKHLATLKFEAYSDYLRAVAASGHLRSDDDLVDAEKSAADAKTRIIIYGDTSVIKALARFEESGAALNNAKSITNFISLVSAMRTNKMAISVEDIRLILLGNSQRE